MYRMSPYLRNFIYSGFMAEIAQAALGPDVFLFNEQWVVKGPEQGTTTESATRADNPGH